MGQSLGVAEPAASDTLAEADDILGFSLSALIQHGPEETLTDTINAQPAILATSIAILRVLQQHTGVAPAYVAGHSLGEFSALVCAGALSFADGLRLVRERGRLMQEAGQRQPGGMAAILGLDAAPLAELCARAQQATGLPVQVANDNCPGQIVISGASPALQTACDLAAESGAKKVVPLQVSIASHSPLMAEAAAEFARAVAAVPILTPAVPVIGNTTALPLADAGAIRAELVAQLTGSVRWTESMQFLLADQVGRFVEIGPKDVLTNLIKRIDRQAGRLSVQDAAGIEQAAAWLAA